MRMRARALSLKSAATGEQATLYRALRELTCSPCGNIIREGELFTREAGHASGLPLVRLCRGCAPFTTGGGLLDALLAPDGEDSRPAAPPSDAREKVRARLGSALAARGGAKQWTAERGKT